MVTRNGNVQAASLTSPYGPYAPSWVSAIGSNVLGTNQNNFNPEAAAVGNSTTAPTPNYLWYLLAIFVILVILKIAVEHEKSGMDVAFVGVSVYNWVAIGLMAALFLVVIKTILNKYPVSGFTQIFNAA
jgi:hypothetical protein